MQVDLSKGWHSRIARRFVFSTVLCSSIIALVITGTQLFADYRTDISSLNQDIDNLERSRLPSLIESVWSIDNTLIETQLEGILQIEGVEYVAVDTGDKTIAFGNEGDFRSKVFYRYPLERKEGNRLYELGELRVVVSMDHVYQRLIERGITVLLANSIKTFFVALFIIFIYQMMIGRHLSKMAEFARNYDPEHSDQHLSLGRINKHRDEIEDLESAFNHWIDEQNNHLIQQKKHSEEIAVHRDELSQANEELTQFAYSVSHDLKAPLTSITGLLNFAEKDIQSGDSEQALFAVTHAKQEAGKLSARIEDMLTLAKSDLANNQWETIELESIVQDIWSVMKLAYSDKDLKLETAIDLSNNLVSVKVRIQLILENLISNALKYASPERESINVKVTSRSTEKDYVITIDDNGMGIPEEFHDRVFKVFERFANSDKPSSGLGLAIVKKNVSQLGGNISFESSPLGTSFKIVLPQDEAVLSQLEKTLN